MQALAFFRSRAFAAVAGYAALYALMLGLLARYQHYDPADAVFVLAALGVVLPLLAWLFTLKTRPTTAAVKRPGQETAALGVYLVLFAVLVLGYGFTWLRDGLHDPRAHTLAIFALKLLTMVMLPVLLLRGFGYPLKATLCWDLEWRRHGFTLVAMALVLLCFQAGFSQSLKHIADLHAATGTLVLGIPLCFLWLAVDTGLTEEYLFRVVLQTRLAAWLKSETAGVVVGAVLFGLAHAPGYYLRNAFAAEGIVTEPSVLMSAGYSVVITSAAGLLFGVLWARTRSLVLVTALHALMDLLPNLPDFIRNWLSS